MRRHLSYMEVPVALCVVTCIKHPRPTPKATMTRRMKAERANAKAAAAEDCGTVEDVDRWRVTDGG